MKIEKLNVGNKFYTVSKYAYFQPEIKTNKVIKKEEILNDNNEIITNIYIGKYKYHDNYENAYCGMSITKAKKVLKQKQKQYENYLKKQIKQKENYKYNEANLLNVKSKYIDKYIMIKFRGYPSKESKYIKTRITGVESTYKKDVYILSTPYNDYLTSKENKNWYFWTRERELIEEREKINKELRNIRQGKTK